MTLRTSRREFLTAAMVVAVGSSLPWSFADDSPRVAVTMDDFNWSANPVILNPRERNDTILQSLRKAGIHAALFVTGKFLDGDATAGKEMLAEWDHAGHVIGNHSYSHWYYPAKEISEYQSDILKCEKLLLEYRNFQKLFRFPFLKEGKTEEQRDEMRAFLRKHGYRNGHVTIDTSDWYIDQRLRERVQQNPNADLQPYKQYYINHLLDRASYYDRLGREVLKRPIPHTMLIHYNTLNALFLGDVLAAFAAEGWKWIDAKAAFRDPVFESEPDVLPAGESLMHSLARNAGLPDVQLQYPGEDSEYEKGKMDKLGL